MTSPENRHDGFHSSPRSVPRRDFLKTTGAVVAVGGLPLWAQTKPSKTESAAPESVVKLLYDSLDEDQRKVICFPWDHVDPKKGLLRTRVEPNWNITPEVINSDFFTDDQRDMTRDVFNGMIHSDWHDRFDLQLEDDAGGWGEQQSITIFGEPGNGKFEFVMTGRHMTLRCDGNSADHVAFGGPIFYGHAADGFNEGPEHSGNVFWPQAVVANKLYEMLDGKQRALASVPGMPRRENQVGFQGPKAQFSGIPVTELSADQRQHLQKVLNKLIEPYRKTDRDEVIACLKAQGGLDACSLAFYQDGDIGDDQVWDNWRLEGPSFVWYFRGSPHVHVWVNIADKASPKLNA